jgi:hypothetical protein
MYVPANSARKALPVTVWWQRKGAATERPALHLVAGFYSQNSLELDTAAVSWCNKSTHQERGRPGFLLGNRQAPLLAAIPYTSTVAPEMLAALGERVGIE